MRRTFLDQFFSRMVNAYAGIIINTGEDNYLTTSDAYEKAYTVLASQFINEQFALMSGLQDEQIGLGHAFEIDPRVPNTWDGYKIKRIIRGYEVEITLIRNPSQKGVLLNGQSWKDERFIPYGLLESGKVNRVTAYY
jgi:cellobiose phosphorylase